MKKFIMMSALLLFATGCNENTESPKEVISPVVPDDDVAAFFEKHLPGISGGNHSDCFFVDAAYDYDSEDKGNRCVVINSMAELKANVSDPSVELPAIDFESYTLIVGRYYSAGHEDGYILGGGYYLVEQNLIVGSKQMELNLIVQQPETWTQAPSHLYYWGLYPKLPQGPISVNMNVKLLTF